MTRRKRLLLAFFVVLPLAGATTGLVAHEPRPRTGRTGADAERLTRRLESDAGLPSWERTGAIAFRFVSGTEYLWDRQRAYVRVRFEDSEVFLPLEGGRAVIREHGSDVRAPSRRVALRERAYRMFINDSFWLYPFRTFRDRGVTRSVIDFHGRESLLVEYASGGVTPGDAYVWTPAHDGKPLTWAMFVSVLPIGGIETGWEHWVRLPTGLRIATDRSNGPLRFTMISGLRAARTLEELEPGADPFAALAP